MSGIKRSSEISSTSSSKIIKLGDTLEIPDDVHLQTWQLDDEGSIIVHLVYDTLYENFFMTMIKKDKKGEKKIMLDIPSVNKLSAQMEKNTVAVRKVHVE